MSGKRDRPLAWVIAFHTAVVMVLGMGAYAVAQYYLSPGRTVVGLILEHLSHVLVLGVFTYAMLYLVLLRKVVRPINTLYWKLYSFAGGDFRPASIRSDVREINEIAEGINTMLAKIDHSCPEVSLDELSQGASQLRDLAQKSDGLAVSAREMLLDVAKEIDNTVAAITVYALDEEAGGKTAEAATGRTAPEGGEVGQPERLAI